MKYSILDVAGGSETSATRDMAKEQFSCYEGRGPKRRPERRATEPLGILTTGLILGVKYAFDAGYRARGVGFVMEVWMIFEFGFMSGLFLT